MAERVRDVRTAKPPRPRFGMKKNAHNTGWGFPAAVTRASLTVIFGPTSYYSTHTLDDEHEVHTFAEAKRIVNNYVRRLKRAYPKARIMVYIGRGKNTHRIHVHMVSEGVPEEVIREKWGLGGVQRVVHLREHNYYDGVDHGCDYTGLANYLFDHWTPEQGGHRWKQTSNMLAPEAEPRARRCGSIRRAVRLLRRRGYKLVETRATKYGYLYFKYVKIPEPRRRGKGIATRPRAGRLRAL